MSRAAQRRPDRGVEALLDVDFALEDGRGLAQRLRVPYDNVFEVGLHGSQGCRRALGLAERCEAHGLQHEGAGGRHLLCSGGACLNVSFTQAPRRIDGVLFLWVGSVLLPHRSALLGIDARAALAPHNRERAIVRACLTPSPR